jgi:hypothetical protein
VSQKKQNNDAYACHGRRGVKQGRINAGLGYAMTEESAVWAGARPLNGLGPGGGALQHEEASCAQASISDSKSGRTLDVSPWPGA